VAKEVKSQQLQRLEPYRSAALARAYRRLTRRERKEEHAMERASEGPQKKEL
jgi:hypothetical protein